MAHAADPVDQAPLRRRVSSWIKHWTVGHAASETVGHAASESVVPVLARKTDGSRCICYDYRGLRPMTEPLLEPLP
jgi:hypothetical protein